MSATSTTIEAAEMMAAVAAKFRQYIPTNQRAVPVRVGFDQSYRFKAGDESYGYQTGGIIDGPRWVVFSTRTGHWTGVPFGVTRI